MSSFANLPKYLFTSESVTEGHPDKLCDQVSDAVLDELLRADGNQTLVTEIGKNVRRFEIVVGIEIEEQRERQQHPQAGRLGPDMLAGEEVQGRTGEAHDDKGMQIRQSRQGLVP